MSVFCYISVIAAFNTGAHMLGTGIGQNAYSLRNSRNSRVRRGTLIRSREQPLAAGPSVWNGHSLVARRCNALGGAWSRSVASANYVVCSFFTTCIALSCRRLRVVSVCVVVDSLICVGWYVSWDGRVASSVAWPMGRASDCAFGANRQALAVSFAFRIIAYYYFNHLCCFTHWDTIVWNGHRPHVCFRENHWELCGNG